MRTIPMRALLCGAIALAMMLVGCDSAPTDPFEPGEPVALALQVSTTAEMVQTIVVEVTGQGIPVPILANLEMVDGTASGTIVVPAGQDRTFTARGFDAEGGVTHEGSVTEDVRPGQAVVRIPLVPRGVGVPIEVVASFYVVSIDPAATEMNIGEERQFTATVTEAGGQPVDVDPTTLRWGSSNPVMATVDAAGLVSAGGIEGSVRIGVSYQGVAAESDLTITGDDLLSISLATSSSEVEPGEPFDVVITVRNRGEDAISNVDVWLSVEYTRIKAAPDADGVFLMAFFPIADDTGEKEIGTALYYTIPGQVQPGQEVVWTATYYSYLIQGSQVLPEASITSWEGPEDPYLRNNEATAEIAVTDGRIVFASDRSGSMNLFIANPDGTGLHQLTDHPAAETYPAWSRDRSRIAFVRSGALWVINADGTGETQLNVPADNRPTWSPDGKRIAVSGRPAGSEYRRILIYDLENGSYSELTDGYAGQHLIHPDWSPNGRDILAKALSDPGYLIRIDVESGSADGFYFEWGGSCFQWSGGDYPMWSPDGTAFAFSTGSPENEFLGNAIWIARAGASDSGITCSGGFSNFEAIISSDGTEYRWPDWSPDGEHLVLGRRYDLEGATFDLLTVRSDGTGPMPNITNWPSNDIHPRW